MGRTGLLLVDEPPLTPALSQRERERERLTPALSQRRRERLIAVPPPAHHQWLEQPLYLATGPSGGTPIPEHCTATCGFGHNTNNAFAVTARLPLSEVDSRS